MRVSEWLTAAEQRLSAAGVDSPRLDAQLIAAHTLGITRGWLLAEPDTEVEPEILDPLLARREKREPLTYILGIREFYGRPFQVTRDVLIPRQETETLVDAFIALQTRESKIKVLDLGTGSGCIAVTLKLECPHVEMVAVDVSEEAIRVAHQNAEHLHAGDIRFVQSDAFSELDGETFGAIITNPPYVASEAPLMPEIRDHEPHVALFSGPTGVEFLQRLVNEAPGHLASGGFLLTEVGDGQAAEAISLFERGKWRVLRVFSDLNGTERALACKPPTPRMDQTYPPRF